MKCVNRCAMLLWLSVVLAGCGEAADRRVFKAESAKTPAGSMTATYDQDETGIAVAIHNYHENTDGTATRVAMRGADAVLPAGQQAGAAENANAAQRRIIYTATVILVVKEFEKARANVAALVAKHGGFIANSSFAGQSGATRSGQWMVRIPVAKYDDFLAEAETLGELESLNSTSQEVTEEYVDVEARIRNKQKEEERLLGHLKDSTGKLEEILNVEREISRVREELERLQGRMRFLKDRTELTTVTLHVREDRNYVPATAPTFASRVRSTFARTLDAMLVTGQNLVIAVVAAAPWLAVLAVPVSLLYVAIRRRLAARKRLAS
ncbi:MAG: DUF4349 domain-containing protein [Planctomycetaceae bacterium]